MPYDGDLAGNLAPLAPFSTRNPVSDSVRAAEVFVAGKHGVTEPTCPAPLLVIRPPLAPPNSKAIGL